MLKKFEGERRKQLIALAVAVVVVGGGILFLSEALKPKEEKPKGPPPPKIEAPPPKKAEEESFKALYGQKVSELEQKVKALESRQENMEKALKEKEKVPPMPPPLPSQQQFSQQQLSQQQQPFAPPPPPPPATQPPPKPKLEENLIAIKEQKVEKVEKPQAPSAVKEEEKPKKPKKPLIIPAGSFVRGVLLSGLDAPTGGKAQTSPHPVLIRITDKAVLPNLWKADIRDCFVIGSGYGDLSAERAYIRLEVLSCVKKDHTVVEKPIKGYVAGEDGKIGLLGRVVSKQGAILARLLLAGFIDGLAKVFGQSGTTVVVAPQGTLSTVEPSRALQTSLAGGFSSAAKEIVEQYKKLADEMYPVVEINAGRNVDLVFLQSINFETGEQKPPEKTKPEGGEKE